MKSPCKIITSISKHHNVLKQVYQLTPMGHTRWWPSRPINHCTTYTAPCPVTAIVVGCIDSNSTGLICCITNLQEMEAMKFKPYRSRTCHVQLPSACHCQRCCKHQDWQLSVFISHSLTVSVPVWDKVPEGSILIFEHTLITLTQHSIRTGKPVHK